jgi:hypothetical protein
MNSILIAALIASAATAEIELATPAEAAERLAGEVGTGSLIVSRGDCLAVKIYSASLYTHVGAVVARDGEIYVYDAMQGCGVRKQLLRDYVVGLHDAAVHPFHLCQSLTDDEAERFEKHLEGQLGRPYAIKHHLTGNRAAGVHCSEYVTDALIAAGRLRAKQPSRVSPASLVEGVLTAGVHQQAATLQLTPPPAQRVESENWFVQLWFDTGHCTTFCCRKLCAWFCCK